MNMKKKILLSITVVFVLALIAFIVSVASGAVSYSEQWMKCSILGCLLVIFICLNCMFGRYTDTDEALFCLRTLKRLMNGIRVDKDVNFVKRKAIHNQVNSALVLLNDIAAQNDYYDLRGKIAELGKIRDLYIPVQGEKLRLSEEDTKKQGAVVEGLIGELKIKKGK